MGKGVAFEGANVVYNPPAGVPDDQCSAAHVFRNGKDLVTCWELSDEELADVIRTKRVWFTMQSGRTLFPHFIGSERTVHALIVDSGPVWKLSESATPPKRVTDGCHICDHGAMFHITDVRKCKRDGCPYKERLTEWLKR